VDNQDQSKANSRLVWRMVAIAAVMFGLGFAIAPYYQSICDAVFGGGRVKEASADAAYPIDEKREIVVEFVTAVNGKMPLEFRAETAKLKIHPGQYYTVDFYAENTSDVKLVGRAIPSISPVWASEHFKKTECFCFSEQQFEPHKGRRMPVRFTVDPAVQADITEMALAYTFFDITEKTLTIKQ
jgi:cytochrome c oxidase assembly protein subunit 11